MININVPETDFELRPRITVFGVGGAGGNAVNNMIRSSLEGVEFVVANTDAQALKGSLAANRIQLGTTITQGLGAGSRPDVGRAAAEEQLDEIMAHLKGANMCFITAGMGGGTGTGAAPVIARAAREQGILTVGVVTKPFHFEGGHRMRLAETGIQDLQQYVDTLIIIPNQNLFRIANEKTTFADAFKMADDVLHAGVSGVTDLMVKPGLINLDFADIRSVMTEMGKAMMGTGEATGDRRALDAAEAAISNPLLDDVSMKGARGVLINITGGLDMTLFEVDEAANRIRDEVDPDANIIFGSTFDESMEGRMRVSVVATGIDTEAMAQPRPSVTTLSVVGGRNARPAQQPRVDTTTARPAAVDYHHMLAPAPMHPAPMHPAPAHPGHATVGATVGATARKLESEAPAQPAPEAAPSLAHAEAAPTAGYFEAQATPAPRAEAATDARRGERRGDSFIPPAPADAGPRAPIAAPTHFAPATVSASEPAQPKKRQSLLGMVTGLGRRIVDSGESPAPSARPEAAPTVGRSPEPALAAPQQPRLTVDPTDRPKLSQAEEDLLDIPAFLRRQAN